MFPARFTGLMPYTTVPLIFVPRYMPRLPFCSHLLAVERVLEFNDHPTLLPQRSWVLHVVAHQFSQSCKLLTSVQIIVVTSILDLDMCYLSEPSVDTGVCVCGQGGSTLIQPL